MTDELALLDATAQAELVRTGQVNPFSPPASIISYGSGADISHPFPDSYSRSRTTSIADITRLSSSQFGSRPGTGDVNLLRPGSARSREAFTSPPQRPLTVTSVAPLTKVERERAKSTMLSAKEPIQKPWLLERDPYSRIAYFLTYSVMCLGIAAGVVRCYTGWYDVPLIKGNLCVVLDQNFDSEDGV